MLRVEKRAVDRRREARQDVASFVVSPIPGSVRNMSQKGFCLETWDPLRVNGDYCLTLGDHKRHARVQCRVVWCRLIATEKTAEDAVISIYRSGVRFLGIEESKAILVDRNTQSGCT